MPGHRRCWTAWPCFASKGLGVRVALAPPAKTSDSDHGQGPRVPLALAAGIVAGLSHPLIEHVRDLLVDLSRRVLDQTGAHHLEHVAADHPNPRTTSDRFDTPRARLLIHGFLILPVRGQVDQPGRSGPEATGIEVEPCQALGEVDVQPLATRHLRVPGGKADQRGGDAPPLMLTGDLGIEEEGVIATVPRHVDKSDQAATSPQARGHPAETVRADLIPPPGRGPAAMSPDKYHHFCIGDRPTPAVLNRFGHTRDRSAARRHRQHGGRAATRSWRITAVPDRTSNRGVVTVTRGRNVEKPQVNAPAGERSAAPQTSQADSTRAGQSCRGCVIDGAAVGSEPLHLGQNPGFGAACPALLTAAEPRERTTLGGDLWQGQNAAGLG